MEKKKKLDAILKTVGIIVEVVLVILIIITIVNALEVRRQLSTTNKFMIDKNTKQEKIYLKIGFKWGVKTLGKELMSANFRADPTLKNNFEELRKKGNIIEFRFKDGKTRYIKYPLNK